MMQLLTFLVANAGEIVKVGEAIAGLFHHHAATEKAPSVLERAARAVWQAAEAAGQYKAMTGDEKRAYALSLAPKALAAASKALGGHVPADAMSAVEEILSLLSMENKAK